MLSMIQGRLEIEEIQREPQITALYKTMRILILRNMLDAILKSSRKKTRYTVGPVEEFLAIQL